MKKKSKTPSVQVPFIRREKKSWGVRLSLQPLPDRPMEIVAEVHDQKPRIRVAFQGTQSLSPLTIVNAETWRTAFGVMLDEARKIVSEG